MERIMLAVGVENGAVQLSIIEEGDESPITIEIDGPTARTIGDLLFKAGCDV